MGNFRIKFSSYTKHINNEQNALNIIFNIIHIF